MQILLKQAGLRKKVQALLQPQALTSGLGGRPSVLGEACARLPQALFIWFPPASSPLSAWCAHRPKWSFSHFLHLSAWLERPSWEGRVACLTPREESQAPSEPSQCWYLKLWTERWDARGGPWGTSSWA